MDETGRAVVPETLAGERVDRAVALLTGWSRREVRHLVESGAVRIDGAPVGRSARLAAGQVLEWTGEPPPVVRPEPDPGVEFTVVHEDEHLIVIEKPAGLVVHPGAGHQDGTLVNGLLARYDIGAVGAPERPGIVHRLDRDTSGLLVVARTAAAHAALTSMLAAHEVDRRYVAVVIGVPASSRGTVDAPIGRSPRTPTKMSVRTGGKPARTHYEVVDEMDGTSLLQVTLETGRTHQIRVHLAAIGHPVFGDAVYGRPDRRLARPFLHAAELEFVHPITGAPIHLSSALPVELMTVLGGLEG